MKRNKIVFLLGILVILIGCYVGLQFWNESKAAKEEEQKEAKAVKVKTLEALTEISYTYNESKFVFEKKDGTWIYAPDEKFPLEQTYVETMENTFSTIQAERELERADALEDYGLEQPAYTIHLKNEAGEETDVYIGNSVNDGYYMTVGDKSKVYTVSSSVLSPIQYDLMSLLSNDAFPYINSGQLEKVVMTKKEKTETFLKDEEDAITTLESAIGGITLSDCADYYMEAAEADAYGMDEKNVTKVEVTYTDSNEKEQEFTFYIGATDSEGENRYVKLGESHIIYKVDRTKFQEMDTLFEK